MTNGRLAVCPGSYDPVTNGHIDIIGRHREGLRALIVGVVRQCATQGRPLFNAEERREFLESRRPQTCRTSRWRSSRNLLVEFARDKGATAIVKGLRAISDFEYEFEMNQLNRKLAPEIESVYIIASPELQLPLLDGRQGDGDVRRRRLRSRA